LSLLQPAPESLGRRRRRRRRRRRKKKRTQPW
jgi:hypothetical protein